MPLLYSPENSYPTSPVNASPPSIVATPVQCDWWETHLLSYQSCWWVCLMLTKKLRTKRTPLTFLPQMYQLTCICTQTSTFLPVINNKVSLLPSQSHRSPYFLNPILPNLGNRGAGHGPRKHAVSLLVLPVLILHWLMTANIWTCSNIPYLSKSEKKKALTYLRSNFWLITLLNFMAKYLEPLTVAVSTPTPQLHAVSWAQPTQMGAQAPPLRPCSSRSPASSPWCTSMVRLSPRLAQPRSVSLPSLFKAPVLAPSIPRSPGSLRLCRPHTTVLSHSFLGFCLLFLVYNSLKM